MNPFPLAETEIALLAKIVEARRRLSRGYPPAERLADLGLAEWVLEDRDRLKWVLRRTLAGADHLENLKAKTEHEHQKSTE